MGEKFWDPKDSRRGARRGRRLNDKARMKKRAIKVFYWKKPEDAIILADNLKNCSCWMCGSQRKSFGDTMQEIRQKSRERYADS